MKAFVVALLFTVVACADSQMPRTEVYRIDDYGNKNPDLTQQLNRILSRLSDRVDKLESIRGTSTIDGNLSLSGSIESGVVPLDRIVRTELSENFGTFTVTSSDTTVATLDFGTLSTDDRIFVFAYVAGTKGGTGGVNQMAFTKSSGSAGVGFNHSLAFTVNGAFFPNGVGVNQTSSTVIRVLTDGTFILRIWASSAGSDTTGTIGSVYAVVFRND